MCKQGYMSVTCYKFLFLTLWSYIQFTLNCLNFCTGRLLLRKFKPWRSINVFSEASIVKGFRTSYHLLASVNIQMNNDNNIGTLYFLYLYA